jgi:chromosome segregation protein
VQTAVESTRASIARLEGQLGSLRARREQLQLLLSDSTEPDAALRQELNAQLSKRLEIENRLNDARRVVGDIDMTLREREHARGSRRQHDARKPNASRARVRVRRDTQADGARRRLGASLGRDAMGRDRARLALTPRTRRRAHRAAWPD